MVKQKTPIFWLEVPGPGSLIYHLRLTPVIEQDEEEAPQIADEADEVSEWCDTVLRYGSLYIHVGRIEDFVCLAIEVDFMAFLHEMECQKIRTCFNKFHLLFGNISQVYAIQFIY